MRYGVAGSRYTRVSGWIMTVMLLGAMFAGSVAQAVPVPYKRGNVTYNPQEQPLVEFLQQFFADQGLAVVISQQLRSQGGTLSGPRSGTAQKVFRSIATSNDLITYYDGSAVYIYLARERMTRYATLPPPRVEDFAGAFSKMRLGDEANTFTATTGNGLVMITGAPRFVEQVQQLADAVNGQVPSPPTVFKYYALRYAWAADTTMTVGNRQLTVPGVATLLRELVSATPQSPTAVAQERLLRPSATRLRGQGLASVGQPPLQPPPSYAPAADDIAHDGGDIPPAAPVPAIDAGPNARIVADTFRNAVIVRDAPDHIGMYDKLIESLDDEPKMVEIEATIIDVNKGRMKKLGIDWRWKNGRTEVMFGSDGVKQNFVRTLGADNIDFLDQLAGFQIGAIVGDSATFITRINALATQDITNVISRPQVMTLNDTEAVIENSQTVYVPVAGAYDVDLFNIVAGTIMRVTPHLVQESGRLRIRMMVQIEDGGVELQQTTQTGQNVTIPLVSRKAVNTQALIDVGQSLLLGGLISDSVENHENKVPLLGDVPLLGALFRKVEKDRARTERLFLITPRLVAANHITSQQVPSDPAVSIDEIRADQEARDRAHSPWSSDAPIESRPAAPQPSQPVPVPTSDVSPPIAAPAQPPLRAGGN